MKCRGQREYIIYSNLDFSFFSAGINIPMIDYEKLRTQLIALFFF